MSTETDLRAAQEVVEGLTADMERASRARTVAIRSAHAEGFSPSRITAILGVDRQVVYRALRRE